jgi:hypothetical protein
MDLNIVDYISLCPTVPKGPYSQYKGFFNIASALNCCFIANLILIKLKLLPYIVCFILNYKDVV